MEGLMAPTYSKSKRYSNSILTTHWFEPSSLANSITRARSTLRFLLLLQNVTSYQYRPTSPRSSRISRRVRGMREGNGQGIRPEWEQGGGRNTS